MKSRIFIIAFLITLLALPFRAVALEMSNDGNVRELEYNLPIDITVTAIATAGWAITWAGLNHMAPANCRWCQVNSFDDWGHRNIKWSDTGAASKTSDVLAYGVAPLAAYGLDALAAVYDDSLPSFFVDALLITEAATLSAFATQLTKIAVGRQRPYAHYGGGSQRPRDNTSFYSGHASLAFSLAVASGTIATMRGYRLAPAIWGVGLATAATASYLRLAADKHYLTDTIAGAVLGSAFGFAIPYLFHRPKDSEMPGTTITAMPAEGGGIVMVSGRW